MQQTTLPHRVGRSAQDLASATLTGATFELKDPRESKYASTSSQASTSLEHLSSWNSQQRPGIYARGSSFRHEIEDAQWRKAEQDFERFQQLDDFQSEFNACLASLNDTIAPQENSRGFQSVSIVESDHRSNQILEAAESSMIDVDQSTSRHELTSESIAENDVDFARTAAVRRLNQIGAHLQRNLAMQTLEQKAHLQSHALMNDTRSIAVAQLTRQTDEDVRSATRTNEAESSIHDIRNVVTLQHQDQIESIERQSQSPSEKEDNVLQRQFHCPYYVCHRNLKLCSTSSSSSRQRLCVHVGCDFTTETFSSWAEHIHTPHHDLLGSI
jgi:hypothetical protein